ncbi:MAG: dephospho-CoA kinase [Pseudomonadota bacterium]
MFIIGLTGGIGSGKSTVARFFLQHGATVIESDVLAKEITAKGQPAYQHIIDHFGKAIIASNGELDRGKLRKIIFNDTTERQWLEACLHPGIKHLLKARAQAATSEYVIVDVPLLFEAKMEKEFDRILVIDTKEINQIARVMARDKIDAKTARQIITSQVNLQYRLDNADDIIINDADIDSLEEKVENLDILYTKLAHHKRYN